jgi:hypothetical protein
MLEAQTAAPKFYAQSFKQAQPVLERLKTKKDELKRAMKRWAELESQQLE